MQYKKPPRDEKPSKLRTVWGVRGGKGSKYFSLVLLLMVSVIMMVNFILAIF